MPCPFGALLVTLYQDFSKGFLNGKRNIRGGGQPCGLAAAQKETLYQEMVEEGPLSTGLFIFPYLPKGQSYWGKRVATDKAQ
jgi:hypothetical protein